MRVALVGAGFAGGIHAQAWSGLPGIDLLVIDEDAARAHAVADRFGAEASSDAAAALATDVDVVDVCTPTSLHAELAVAAAGRGKHVLCEKPLAMTLAECDAVIDAARAAGVTFMVGQVLRFWPEYERLRELVRSGELGSLRGLACHRFVTRPGPYAPWLLDQRRGLGLAEVAIHDLDFAASLLGRPSALTATGVGDEHGLCHLQALLHPRTAAAIASVEAGWGTPAAEPFIAGYRALFERGVVEYDSRRSPTLRVVREDGVEVGTPPEEATEGGPWAFDATPYVLEVQEFARCARDRIQPERCRPEDARQAVELALACIDAATTGLRHPL